MACTNLSVSRKCLGEPLIMHKASELCLTMCLQPDVLEDLSYVIMHEMARMIYRVDPDDVARACNQV